MLYYQYLAPEEFLQLHIDFFMSKGKAFDFLQEEDVKRLKTTASGHSYKAYLIATLLLAVRHVKSTVYQSCGNLAPKPANYGYADVDLSDDIMAAEEKILDWGSFQPVLGVGRPTMSSCSRVSLVVLAPKY